MRLWFLWAALAVLPASAIAADFVGAESCKACHPEAFAAWRTSKHARAFETLSSQQKDDARCASCHAPDLRDQKVVGVTCEACHGGGQYYSPRYVMKDPELSRLVGLVDPSERQCRSCHDASSPSLRPFEFVEKLKLIDHWSEERARRKAAQPKPPAPPAGKKKTGALQPGKKPVAVVATAAGKRE
jgi:hypothetical protein